MKRRSCFFFWAAREEMSCTWSVSILLVVTEFRWHKKGVCKIPSTTLGNGVSWGRGLHARTTKFTKMRARTRKRGEWERRDKREGGTHLGEQGDCKWKKSKEWLGGGIGPLLGIFNPALHLSHSYWRKATAATLEHAAEELLVGQKNNHRYRGMPSRGTVLHKPFCFM